MGRSDPEAPITAGLPKKVWVGRLTEAEQVATVARDVTALLHRWGGGDKTALDQLAPILYEELQRIARSYMLNERPDHTLQPTALVHEAYLRLVGQDHPRWRDRAHFLGLAARLMRQILVDHARKHRAQKRGGGMVMLPLEAADCAEVEPELDVLAVDDALSRLEAIDKRKSRVIELRFFGGMTNRETAAILGISVATIGRDLRMAEAWLCRELRGVPT
jgi:RNA polymerase sigma factor (TIGR02999 family)